MDFFLKDSIAVADGKTINTTAIQESIDICHAAGGGRVIVSGGTYVTGTIILKSNVEIYIEADGKLLGSPYCEDYPERQNVRHVKSKLLPRGRNACLIFAEEAENIGIGGPGVIDGNGQNFVRELTEEERDTKRPVRWRYKRIDAPTPPRVVFFAGCRNVKVTDVSMMNQPAGWSYWIHDCDYVTFDRCKIVADLQYPNNDGIHVNSSRNVTISNCLISCGDDCIVVRANNSSLSKNKVCEKVTVTNCNLTSYSSGIRVGWINDGVIRNCSFSNIVMTDTLNAVSIRLPGRTSPERIQDEGREATLVENLSFNNIVMDRIFGYPINISISRLPMTKCLAIRNIYFSDFHVRGSHMPHIVGREDCPVENIHFTHCSFEVCSSDTETESDADPTVMKLEMVNGITMTDTTFCNMTIGKQTDPDVVMIHNKLGN